MQRLIRPYLCTVTLVGLSLAVVAWIVGECCVAGLSIGSVSMACGSGGWEISRWDSAGTMAQIRFFGYQPLTTTTVSQPLPRMWGIFIYHWLVVMLFAVSYGLLMWTGDWRLKSTDFGKVTSPTG